MNKKILLKIFTAFAVFTLVGIGILVFMYNRSENVNLQADNIQRIEYSRNNGSVNPPERYTTNLIITPTSIEILEFEGTPEFEDSYKIILDEEVDISQSDFSEIVDFINNLEIREIPPNKECIGGSSTSLEIVGEDGNNLIDGYYAMCGDDPDGSLNSDIRPLEDFIVENYL
jgi:hypothetical protein